MNIKPVEKFFLDEDIIKMEPLEMSPIEMPVGLVSPFNTVDIIADPPAETIKHSVDLKALLFQKMRDEKLMKSKFNIDTGCYPSTPHNYDEHMDAVQEDKAKSL